MAARSAHACVIGRAITCIALALHAGTWLTCAALASGPSPTDAECLIDRLSSEDYEERQAAAESLEFMGEPALKALRTAAASTKRDLETRRRAELIAHKIGAMLDAVAAIKALGGVVTIDEKAQWNPVVGVSLEGLTVNDWHMKKLARIRTLQKLTLRSTAITGAGLQELGGLTRLRALDVSGCLELEVGNQEMPLGQVARRVAFLQHLAGLKNLEELQLAWTATCDDDLADLKALSRLRRLNLHRTQISDAGIQHLVVLNELAQLDLSGTDVTDLGKQRLKGTLPKLLLGQLR